MKLNPFNKKIGIALGGGAARGLAHIGVLKALDEKNINIDYISGTSAGALVASYFAFHKDLNKLDKLPELLRVKTVLNFSLSKMGLMNTDSLEKALKEDFADVNIEDSPIPLAICTTDINTGESVYFRSGPLIPALCASSAIPGIVQPVKISDRLLVDGGISNNLPVDILNTMGAGITIGVNLNGVSAYPEVKSMVDVITNSIDIAIDLRTKEKLSLADMSINLDLSKFSRLDNLNQQEKIIEQGYKSTLDEIGKIKRFRLLSWLHLAKNIIKDILPLKIKLPNIFKNINK
tara:strand:- start:123682 stop:124554 length:873 start_codon:yes stop_codon:yes gene_type:complete